MLFYKRVLAVFLIVLIPLAAMSAGIPGLEGLKEVSDDDLEEICGSIMPDDNSQMILSRSTGAAPGREGARRAGKAGDASQGSGALGASSGQGRFDVAAYAQSVSGGIVSADVNTSGLNESVAVQRGNLKDILTPNNLLGSGGMASPVSGVDYAASGVVDISAPKFMGVDMSKMGAFKASVGINVSAKISVTP